MKFFLDSANLDEIRDAAQLGLIDGVTTNPSLIAKEGGVEFKNHIAAICEIVQGDVSAEVTSLDTEGMLREGREYARIAPNVIIKCPLTRDGLKATCTGARTSRISRRLMPETGLRWSETPGHFWIRFTAQAWIGFRSPLPPRRR